jgi:hypothetical protein
MISSSVLAHPAADGLETKRDARERELGARLQR